MAKRPGAGFHQKLALGQIFRQHPHKQLGAYVGKRIADQPKGQRPDFVDPLAGSVQGIGFLVVAVGVKLRVGADIGAEDLYVAGKAGFGRHWFLGNHRCRRQTDQNYGHDDSVNDHFYPLSSISSGNSGMNSGAVKMVLITRLQPAVSWSPSSFYNRCSSARPGLLLGV
jgi:hypothetical protein